MHATYAAIATMAALRGVPVSADPAWGMVLDSRSLDSKWGFYDGDCPDTVTDMVEAYFGRYWYVEVWHPVLWDLVHEYLLPALDAPPAGLYRMSTLHNPVRLETPLPADFAHAQVVVPWTDVLVRVIATMDNTVNDTDLP